MEWSWIITESIDEMHFHSINKMLEQSFARHWELPAISNYDGKTLSYRDMAKRIALLHIAFRQYGLEKGDRVAICGRNQYNWGVAFLAALTYGAVPVPILHEFKPESIQHLVNHSGSKVLFVDDVIWEGLSADAMSGLKVVVQLSTLRYAFTESKEYTNVRDTVFEEFRNLYPDGFYPSSLHYHCDAAGDLAMINYTSGTSGFSKGVMIPYRSLYFNLHFSHFDAEPQMDCNSELVSILPSAHMYGLLFEFLHEMLQGCHVHFLTRTPSPKIIMNAFQKVRPSLIISVPLIIEKVYKLQLKPVIEKRRNLLKLPVVSGLILRKMREGIINAFGGNFEEIILGGAALNPEVEHFFHKIHFPFTVGYGMTECAPIITYTHWNKCKEGSCGKAVNGCEIRIDSPDPVRIPGEVQVRGDNVFLGYYNNPEATAEAFTPDGWFRTGDMGVLDSEGYLYLRGRNKCMILSSNGQNIYPEELEAVINNEAYVNDSLVIEDENGLTALIYADYDKAASEGMSREEFETMLTARLPEINRRLPVYAQLRKMELRSEDFERTPKKSIKRYLYQRNG